MTTDELSVSKGWYYDTGMAFAQFAIVRDFIPVHLAQQLIDFWQHISAPLAWPHSSLDNPLIGNYEPERHAGIRPK